MSITAIGLILIPLSLLIFLFKAEYLVQWAILMAAFQAASVINLGGSFPIGIVPYFFVTILIAIRFFPLWLSGRISFAKDDPALYLSRPLLLLTFWGAVSAFLLPVVFAGVGVDTPRAGMDRMFTAPLQWSMSNAAQASYLVLNCIFLIYMVWHTQHYNQVAKVVRAFIWSGVIVALIGCYQEAAHFIGFPYPDEFFNSNPAWRQLFEQSIAGTHWWRLSATFNEPSGAGAFFGVWSAFLLFLATDDRTTTLISWLLLAGGIAMLFLTTSTTGYATAAILVAMFVWRELVRLFVKGTIRGKSLFSIVVIAIGLVGAAALLPDFRDLLEKIVFQKGQTVSAQARGATIWEAMNISAETWGLGVGLGSNRPSGMLFYILSNLGLPGTLLFGYLVYVTWQIVSIARREPTARSALGGYLTAAGWAFAIELFAMATSGADISSPHLWIAWGLVVTIGQYTCVASREMSEFEESRVARAEAPPDSYAPVVLHPGLRVG